MARILTIEDDPVTAREIVSELQAYGNEVECVGDGRAGLDQALHGGFDAITLDRMLPGMDGLSVVTELRRAGVDTPVLMISALSDVDARVRGLRAGGDDYLVKPFSFTELLARLEALGRRSDTVAKETILRIGDLAIDLIARSASRRGRKIPLLPREFQLLEYLVRNEGRVVSRAMLLQHVWDLHFDPSTNIIDVYVGRVRRKVDDAQAYPLIHTIRGIGYCLRAPG